MNTDATTMGIEVDRLRAGLDSRCLLCARTFRLGLAAWAMRCGREVLGYVCRGCLTPSGRDRLHAVEQGKGALR
ncbi:MAG: hypothetical protein ABI603_04270 [Acidobacteriota bacterium]